MQAGAQKKLSVVFWLLAVLDVICIICEFKPAHCVVKLLLMPSLIFHLSTAKGSTGKNLVLAGLFFSWIGDGLLLFESRSSIFFIGGLVSFLTTHIFYIIYFLRIRSQGLSLLKKQPLLALLVIGYGAGLVWLLFPHLGGMKIPVMAYAVVICTMLISSLSAYGKINKAAGNFFVIGAGAFILSDSLLAIDKFYHHIPYSGVFIMITYCAAQYCIVTGFRMSE